MSRVRTVVQPVYEFLRFWYLRVFGPVLARVRSSFLLKFALSVFVILILTAIVGSVALVQTSETISKNAEETMVRQAESVAIELTRWIEGHRRPVRMMAAHDVYKTGNAEQIEAYLTRVKTEQLQEKEYNIHYANAGEGEIVASTESDRAGTAIASFPWSQRYELRRLNAVYTSEPYTTEDNRTVIAFVSLTNEVTNGRIILEVPISDRERAFQKPYAGSFTYVVNSERNVVIASDRAQPIEPYLQTTEMRSSVVTAGLNGTSGFSKDPAKNAELPKQHVVGFAPVRGKEWVVIEHAPASQTRQLQTDVTRTIAALISVALVGLLLFAGTVGRKTVSDISSLSAKAVEIADGNYDVELETTRKDEIGTLFDAFSTMRTALVDRIQEADRSRRQAERFSEQLQVVDRLLRHNLKTDMNVILLQAEAIRHRGDDSVQEAVEKIIERSSALLDTAKKERRITEALSTDTETTEIDLVDVLDNAIEAVSSQYPTATIQLGAVTPVSVAVVPQFSNAVHELIENAVVHNDQAQPEVTVSLDTDDSHACIRVADNGPGIPEMEKEVRTETQEIDALHHANGVGLWLVYWFVSQADGQLRFEQNDPRGSVVVIEIPASEAD